jgi:anti-anti-sigma factor
MAHVEGASATLAVSETAPGQLVVAMGGEFDMASIKSLEAALDTLLSTDAGSVVVDLRDLGFMDSSGVALLLRIVNRFGPVDIQNANAMIRRIIDALGLADRLRVLPV